VTDREREHVTVPLTDWVREIVRQAVAEHITMCPMGERVQKLEMRASTLIGFMVGSGVISGGAVGLIAKLWG